MAWEYSEKTKQLFMDAVHGKPGTHLGEIENPDGFGEHGSIACGDAMRFTFRVRRHPTDPTQDVITEARYLTFGCTSAIAASEALCALIEQGGYTPIEALKITNQDIVEFLEGLPRQKIHCSVMGAEALEAAVFNWAQRRGVDLQKLGVDLHADEQDEGRIVCKCFSLSEPYIRRKIKELNLHTIAEITGAIKAGGACMSCHHVPGGLQDLLDEIWGAGKPELEAAAAVAHPRRDARRRADGRRAAGFRLPVRQEDRKGRRRVRPAHAPPRRRRRGNRRHQGQAGLLPAARAPARAANTPAPDVADAGRTDLEGDGRRADSRRSACETAYERHLRRQQRHHAGRPGSLRGDGPVSPRGILQSQLDVRAGPADGPRLADARADDRPTSSDSTDPNAILFTVLRHREQQHGHLRRGPGEPATAATSSPPPSSTRPCSASARNSNGKAAR